VSFVQPDRQLGLLGRQLRRAAITLEALSLIGIVALKPAAIMRVGCGPHGPGGTSGVEDQARIREQSANALAARTVAWCALPQPNGVSE
jgi:hypothetical protein